MKRLFVLVPCVAPLEDGVEFNVSSSELIDECCCGPVGAEDDGLSEE